MVRHMTKDNCCNSCTQASPNSNLAKPRYFGRLRQEEKKYRDKVSTESAMDWLYRHKIVFDVLPEDEICCLETIATTPSLRIKALGNLTYLENEPNKEEIGALPIILTLASIALGTLLGVEGQADDPSPGLPMATGVALAVIFVLLALMSILRKNSRISSIAAWAKSWSAAIREYKLESPPEGKCSEDTKPYPRALPPLP